MRRSVNYFVSAGEQSGDLLAADLVVALKEAIPGSQAHGVVGDALRAAGAKELVDMREFNVMGISQVAQQISRLRMLETTLLQRIDRLKPKFAVLVDFPGLHLRLAEQLRLRQIPVIQYIAPKVWAWGAKRVRNIREDFNLVLGILPFEQEFFRKAGINYKYIGSPHKDRTSKVMVRRESLGITTKGQIVALLPGSRVSELEQILPMLQDAATELRTQVPDVEFYLPLAGSLTLHELFSCAREGSELKEHSGATFVIGQIDQIKIVSGMSLEIMAIADAALVASGTATLECALLGTPLAVLYIMDSFTYEIAKEIVHLQHFSLVNLIAGEKVVEEYIQNFSVSTVVEELRKLLKDTGYRDRMKQKFTGIRDSLHGDAAAHASTAIAELIAVAGSKSAR